MKSSVFVFGTDLVHEGYEAVLDGLQHRGTVGGITLSATYHDARDVFPHNPRYHVFRNEGDVAWFGVEPGRYASGLVPRPARGAEGADVLDELCRRAERRGMPVTAWTIFLHNSVLATAFPDCATQNVFGDPYLTDLCPANPRVRAYCRELAADLARYPVDRLLAESLHYRPLEHGEHHERYLIDIPPNARMLMSLCFCRHCCAAGLAAGISVEALAAAIRSALEPVWAGEVGQAGPDPLLPKGPRAELAAYVGMRAGIVASLVAEVREAMGASQARLSFIDHAGAMHHVLPGTAPGQDVLRASRGLGVDPAAVAAESSEICVLGYVADAEILERVLARYREALGAETRLSVALRPLVPDCRDPENLHAKVEAVRAAGASGVDFYHYAMMPLRRLDWIRQALGGGGPGAGGDRS